MKHEQKSLSRITRKQAFYLFRKWKSGDITDRFLLNWLGVNLYCDLTGGWFVDFYTDELMEDLYG